MEYISLNFKYLREKKNWTKTKIAEEIGKSSSLIGNYENGTVIPPVPVLQSYSKIFGVSVGDLVEVDLTKENKTGTNMVSDPSIGYGVSVLQRKYQMLTNELEIRREELIILQQAIQGDADALAALQKIDPKLATKLKKLLDCA